MASKKKSKKGKKKDDELLTKLHTAETAFHVKKYLKRDMEPGKANAEGDAPIHYYIKRKDKHRYDCLMAFLIHSNCEFFINLVNNDGMTALHLACQRNDLLCTKALIAFDADLNLINYDNCTPLDIVTGWYKSLSEIPRLLSDLGGIHAADVKKLQRQESDDYEHDMGFQENPHSIYFQEDPPEGEPSAHQTIRNRFGLDYQLMSIRKSMEDSLGHGTVPAVYFGGTEGLEFHDGRVDVKEEDSGRQPASMQLESLPEEEEPSPPPVASKTDTRYQTPDTSIEMALTEASVILAKQKALDVNTPDSSIVSGTSVLQKNKFLASPSPRSVSPHSPSPIDQSAEEEEPTKQPTQEELAKAYSVLYSPKISPGVPGNAYQPVRNPLSLDHSDEATDWVKVNGNGKQHVHFASPLAEDSKEKDSLLSDYIMVNGNGYSQFQNHTTDKLEQAILSSSDGDEGYAAWLQWREMMRAKKRKEEIRKHLQLSDDHKASPETEKPASKPITSHLAPPKPPTVRHGPAQGARRMIMSRQRQYLRQHSSGGSMNMMKSLVNPHVGVYTSILGSSVAPFLARQEKGARILCLDGGGIKGLIQIEILKHIENRTGKRITELFDWIVGTSTGGIVALGLVYGNRSLEELKKMYFELKDTVFKKQSKLIPTACDTDALEELLKNTLGEDVKMSSIRNPKVLITAVEKKTTDLPLRLFNNCFNDEYSYQPVWKVARYTSAAPLHFKELDDYVDGGVVANNPCQYGMARIQQYLRTHGSDGLNAPKHGKPSKVACVLSIGCGVFPPEPIGNTDILEAMKIHKLHSAPQKLGELVTMLTSTLGKSDDIAMLCQNHCEEQEIPFFRFSPRLGETVGTAETDNEKLCDLIIGAKRLLVESEEHLSKLYDHLGVDV